jgi:hypothetical protein
MGMAAVRAFPAAAGFVQPSRDVRSAGSGRLRWRLTVGWLGLGGLGGGCSRGTRRSRFGARCAVRVDGNDADCVAARSDRTGTNPVVDPLRGHRAVRGFGGLSGPVARRHSRSRAGHHRDVGHRSRGVVADSSACRGRGVPALVRESHNGPRSVRAMPARSVRSSPRWMCATCWPRCARPH